ncbi:MAG: hypothetical protein ACHQRJ_23950 [Alphaproteobacteria bacterium]
MISTSRIKLVGAMALVALLSFGAGTLAQSRYPAIDAAEGALNNALGQLQHARDVFGGHKVNAQGLINQAIGELEAGKGWAAQHGY